MSFLMLILVSFTPSRSIDIVAIEDTVFIVMDKSSQDAALFRYESNILVNERALGNYNNLSLGLLQSGIGDCLAVTGGCYMFMDYGDSLYVINTDDLETIWKSGNLPEHPDFDDLFRIVYVERWGISSRLPRVISYYCTHVTKASDIQGIASAAFNPETCPGWTDELYYFNNDYGWIDDSFHGPVTIGNSPALTVTADYRSFWWPPDYWNIRSQVNEPDPTGPPDDMRVINVDYEELSKPVTGYPCGYCLGSCAVEAVFLWADSSGISYTTSFSGDPLQMETTEIFEYNITTGDTGIAASCYPEDVGILICYYHDGCIKARYRENQWSPYEHIISESGVVYEGDLAVCSVEDGYWIAWKTSGAEYPELAFIDRETLTGIEECQQLEMNRPVISVSPNPFSASTVFVIEGVENRSTAIVRIFDCSGRLVRTLGSGEDCNPSWNGREEDGKMCPVGAYMAIVEYGEYRDACKVLLLR